MTTGQILWANWGYIEGQFQHEVALYVANSKIIEIAEKSQLINKYPDAEVMGGDHLCMLPGLVDSHDHGRALGTVSLGVPDNFLEVWIDGLGTVPRLSPKLAAQYEGLQLIHSGVTSVAHSHNPASYETMFDEVPQTIEGYREAGVRVAMFPPVMDQNRLIYDDREKFLESIPTELRSMAQSALRVSNVPLDDYFASLDELYETYHDVEQHLTHIQVSPVGGQWASDILIERTVDWAKQNSTRMQMHMLESRYQQMYAHRKWNTGFIEHLSNLGALGNWLTLAHMVWVEDSDAKLLAETQTSIAHNPSSNLRLRCGIAPIPRFLDSGVKVGIGMDGHTLDDDQDYLREMRLAYTLGNHPMASSLDIAPNTVLDMGTRLGAQVTFGDEIRLGVLAKGYLADIVLIDWSHVKGDWCPPNFPSNEHLPEFFLRRATRHHVQNVMVHGEWILKDGLHTQLDEAEISQAVQGEFANQSPPIPSPLSEHVRRFYSNWDG